MSNDQQNPEEVDLFEDHLSLPQPVQDLIDKYLNDHLEGNRYDTLQDLRIQINKEGYDFEYGLDAEPYNLHKL
jgi:hypothetical protein